MKVEERLELATRAVETQVDGVPQRPLPVVEQRNRRHKVMVGAMGSALAMLMLVGSAFLLKGTADESTVTAPSATPDAVVAATSVDWSEVDSDFGQVRDTASSDGELYVLTTTAATAATGTRQPNAIYTSTDGESWISHDVDPSLWLAGIDSHDGVLYAISTAPSSAMTAEVSAQVAASRDGGASWDIQDLPLAAVSPAGMGDELYRAVGADIAAGPAGVIAAVNTRFAMDYAPFVPEEYTGEDMYVYRTAAGIEIVDMGQARDAQQVCENAAMGLDTGTTPESTVVGQCADPTLVESGGVVYRATWDELNVEPPVTDYTEMFLSTDGSSFEPVTSPFAPGELSDLVATKDGYVGVQAVTSGASTVWRLWSSTDGRRWVQMAAPSEATWIAAIGEVNGDIVAVGEIYRGEQGAAVFSSSDGGATWKMVDLGSLLGLDGSAYTALTAADVGSGGVTVAVWAASSSDGTDATAHVVTSSDLETWSEVSLPEPQADQQPYPGWVLSGDTETLVSVTTLVDGSTQHLMLVGTP